MAENNLLGKSHKQYVQDQIKTRQEILGKDTRDSKELSWMNGKTSWVRLASSIDIENSPIGVNITSTTSPIFGNQVSVNPEVLNSLSSQALTQTTTTTVKDIMGSQGEERLKLLDLDVKAYMGDTLANNLVLHGGVEKHSFNPDEMSKRYGIAEVYSNTVQTFQAYNSKNGDFGLVAMPGIQSVDIKSKSMGSLREASISLRINDPEQLELIETLYLRIGYSVFLEWGNSSYYRKDQSGQGNHEYVKGADVEPGLLFDFLSPPPELKKCPINFIERIEGERSGSEGNYDALFGRVKNFSWEFDPKGFYNATLEVISWGDIIESLSIDGFYPNIVLSKLNEKEGEKNESKDIEKKDESLLNGFIYEASLPGMLETEVDTVVGSSGFTRTVKQPLSTKKTLIGEIQKQVTTKNTNSPRSTTTTPRTTSEASDYSEALIYDREITNSFGKVIQGAALFGNKNFYSYVRLGDILDFIKTRLSIYLENCSTPIVDINTDTDTNYCFNPEINVSADPSKVMINSTLPLSQKALKNLADNRDRKYVDSNPQPGDPEIKRKIFGLEKPIQGQNTKLEPFTQNKVLSEGKQIANVPVGLIMNIYFEKDFLYNTVDQLRDKKTGQISLYGFIKALLDEANSCLGGVNKLDLRIVNDQTLEIYDQVPLYGWKDTNDLPQEFNIFGLKPKKETISIGGATTTREYNDGSFVTNFGLKTELTNEFATITSIGAQANGSAVGEDGTFLSKWNFGLVDRFYPKKLDSYRKQDQQQDEDLDQKEYDAILDKMLELWSDYSLQQVSQQDINIQGNVDIINQQYIPFEGVKGSYSFPYFRTKSYPQYVKIQKDFFKALIKLRTKQQNVLSNQIGMLPINLNLEMDGISGIRIYDQIRVNTRFLPSYYPEFLMFIIKGISHSFNGNRWVTKIDTIAQPKVQFSKTPALTPDTPPLVDVLDDDAEEAALSETPNGLFDVTKTYNSPTYKIIIDAYGWPIEVTEINGKYYSKKEKTDPYGRNFFPISKNYLQQNTQTFTYDFGGGNTLTRINVHKDMISPLTTVLDKIKAKNLQDGIVGLDFSIYNRDVGGSGGVLSGHAFAIAIDVNASIYPQGNGGYTKYKNDIANGDIKAKVVQEFVNSPDFNWGGNFIKAEKDAHHFTLSVINGTKIGGI